MRPPLRPSSHKCAPPQDSDLKGHIAHIHGVGVKWFDCSEEGCNYKAKSQGNVNQHKTNVHGIGVTWHACPEEGCGYRAKVVNKIRVHLANVHNIGVQWKYVGASEASISHLLALALFPSLQRSPTRLPEIAFFPSH